MFCKSAFFFGCRDPENGAIVALVLSAINQGGTKHVCVCLRADHVCWSLLCITTVASQSIFLFFIVVVLAGPSFHFTMLSILFLSLFLAGRGTYNPTLQISNSHLPHGLAVFAFSFNVTVTPALAALPPSELLNFTFSAPIDSCQSLCSDAGSVITTCTSSAQAATPSPDGTPDPASGCLCSDSTVASLLNCEQCIYTAQIAANVPRSDPRAGSQPLLAGAL